jgi:hypothetical protein
MIVINKQLLAPVPFVVDGATIKVKDLGGDDLVVLPYTPQAILQRSSEAIEFRYILDETIVLFTNYTNDAQADVDYLDLTNKFVAMSAGGGGGGDASAANQTIQIGLETDIKTAVESSATSLNAIEAQTFKSGVYTTTTASITTTNTTVLAANANRKSLIIQSGAGGVLRIGLTSAPTATTGIRVIANSSVSFADFCPINAIIIRTETGVNNITILEA